MVHPLPFWLWHTISFYFCLNPCPGANIWPVMGTITPSNLFHRPTWPPTVPGKSEERSGKHHISCCQTTVKNVLINQHRCNVYWLFNLMTDYVSFLSSVNMSRNKNWGTKHLSRLVLHIKRSIEQTFPKPPKIWTDPHDSWMLIIQFKLYLNCKGVHLKLIK